MESIDILTGQNVIIRYQSATILQRAGALLLDYFFVIAYFFFIFLMWKTVKKQLYSDEILILFFLLWLPALGYHFIFESVLGGKTPGKMIVKIKVTKSDGSIPGIGSYFLRWLLLPIDLFLWGSVGTLFILLSKNHQRLGDMAAGTVVVKTDPSLTFDLDESYYEFSDNYEPAFFHVDRLTAGQIAFITNLLIEPKNKSAVSASVAELANKVKEILAVESNLDDRKFLETIVRDYNYYAALEI
ncbi:MAG: RDD family protein [Candidatus Azobacteroides sp.]|nr:RDD family protein [Candidatus Azobacteroides sp.]